jgi:hypothetical protein
MVAVALCVEVPHMPLRLGSLLGLILALQQPVRTRKRTIAIVGVMLLALWGGACLTLLGLIQGERPYELHQFLIINASLIDFVGTLFLLLWCGRSCSIYLALGACSLALLVTPVTAAWLVAQNPWKFGLSWPATVLALVIAQRVGRAWVVAAALVSTVLSSVFDFRSAMMFSAAAALVAAFARRSRRPTLGSLVRRASVGVLCTWLVIQGGSWLATSGYLGAAIQEKTIWQESQHQNLILTARAEAPTSVQLIGDQLWGYGPGATPSERDRLESLDSTIRMGGNSTDAILWDPLAQWFALHSEAAELMFFFGFAGLPVLVFMGFWILRGLTWMPEGLSAAQQGLLVFLLTSAVWDLLFSPLENNELFSAGAIAAAIWVAQRDEGGGTGRDDSRAKAVSARAWSATKDDVVQGALLERS